MFVSSVAPLLLATLPPLPVPPQGSATAVQDLLERLIPGASANISLRLGDCAESKEPPCFSIAPAGSAQVEIIGSGASELASGLGVYLREFCNVSIGWPRGGGSRVAAPTPFPVPRAPVVRSRAVPYTYLMNVCTHIYSFVWYGWKEWQAFLDWMALSGVNLFLATTGQEELQYRIFEQFGLNDTEIRGWFNGPAFLTWSRGQNEYGAGIAGPLPRSVRRPKPSPTTAL